MGTSIGVGFGRNAARGAVQAVAVAALGFGVLAFGTAAASDGAAVVYKWKDTRGMVHYTDRPPPVDGVLISIERSYGSVRRAGEAPSPARAPTPAAPSANAPEPLNPEAQARLRNQVQADLSTARTEQCKAAKERYENYIRSRRLFREGPNKERIYLSDAELEEARLNAKREADEACAAAP